MTVSGAGIGLALSAAIVRELGGSIQVESEPDKGSRSAVPLSANLSAAPRSYRTHVHLTIRFHFAIPMHVAIAIASDAAGGAAVSKAATVGVPVPGPALRFAVVGAPAFARSVSEGLESACARLRLPRAGLAVYPSFAAADGEICDADDAKFEGGYRTVAVVSLAEARGAGLVGLGRDAKERCPPGGPPPLTTPVRGAEAESLVAHLAGIDIDREPLSPASRGPGIWAGAGAGARLSVELEPPVADCKPTAAPAPVAPAAAAPQPPPSRLRTLDLQLEPSPPLNSERAPPAPAAAPSALRTHTRPTRIEEANILCAEDNAFNCLVLTKLLSRTGCRFRIVHDGRQAVDALLRDQRSDPFHLCLMARRPLIYISFPIFFFFLILTVLSFFLQFYVQDVQMPVLDGLGAAEEIRRLEADGTLPPGPLPIVALSANCTREDREACAAAGMDDFHAKPLQIESLLAIVHARLGLGLRISRPSSSAAVAPAAAQGDGALATDRDRDRDSEPPAPPRSRSAPVPIATAALAPADGRSPASLAFVIEV
eukprot:tig00000331_g24156.t1